MTLRDPGLLAGALARPATWAFGTEVYPGLHTKAAALCDAINHSHPLIDGNKRLSWVLTVLFYRRNGHDLATTPDDGEKFVLSVAAGHRELADIASWLEKHSHELPA
ncbi:hypothetical protein FOE78_07125 [Microlunatus elymi]|uniref:Fido domain-containing protein n=2 Tax=Microlunatus elymi TaxID=2596828 RepID=A0A516Q5E5_9ACTN|nr:hypothetical protein FOE78_07125 [Microlunatus elymi]